MKMKGVHIFVLVLFSCIFIAKCTEDDKLGTNSKQINPVDIYRKLLRTKRAAHREAVAAMLKLEDKYDKQHKMVHMMIQQILKLSNEQKLLLEKLGFKPQDPYPEDGAKREAVSMVIENTAFLGEIVLHLPDLSHDIMKRNQAWHDLVRWCVKFTNDTQIFEANDQKMLHLMAQELNIVEKAEDFHNPYKEEAMMERAVEEEMDRLMKEQKKKEERRNKRKKNRGPSLGGGHTEL